MLGTVQHVQLQYRFILFEINNNNKNNTDKKKIKCSDSSTTIIGAKFESFITLIRKNYNDNAYKIILCIRFEVGCHFTKQMSETKQRKSMRQPRQTEKKASTTATASKRVYNRKGKKNKNILKKCIIHIVRTSICRATDSNLQSRLYSVLSFFFQFF